jgi:hypothetical protein
MVSLLLLLLSLFPTAQAHKPFCERQFDEVVDKLVKVKPSKPEYNDYHFMMMSSYYALNNKEKAEFHLKLLLDSFEPLARRHEAIAGIIEFELSTWRQNDLADIKRDMRISGDRLVGGKVGKVTQVKQKEIVDKLSRLIEEKENKSKQPLPKDGQVGQKTTPVPASDSVIAPNIGEGKVDEKKLKAIAGAWGTMPEKERAKAIMDITRDLPARYRVIIEDYFKALSK